MFDPTNLGLFITACMVLNITPGADMMYVIASGLRSGPRAGFAAMLGVSTGLSLHVLAAAIGVAALMKANPFALEIMRWAGVFWLLWLAYQSFRAAGPQVVKAPLGVAQSFRGGFFVNILNPKTIIFILAFLPQFAPSGKLVELLALGAILICTSSITNGTIGIFAGKLAPRLAHAGFLNRLSGIVMLGLAARLAFQRS